MNTTSYLFAKLHPRLATGFRARNIGVHRSGRYSAIEALFLQSTSDRPEKWIGRLHSQASLTSAQCLSA